MKNVLLVTEPGTRSGEVVDMLEHAGYVVHQAADMRDPGASMAQLHAGMLQTGRPVLVVLDHGAVAARGGDPVLFAEAAVQVLNPAVVTLMFRDLVRQAVIEWAEYGNGDYDPAMLNSFYTAARARRGRVNRVVPKPDLALQEETLDRSWVPQVRALAKTTGADLRVINMPRAKDVADWVSQSIELFRATQGRPLQQASNARQNNRRNTRRTEGQLVVPMGGGGARTNAGSLHKLDASSVPMGGITGSMPAGHTENLNFSTAARRMGGDGLLSGDMSARQTHSLAFGAAAQRMGSSGLKVGSRDQQGQVLSVNAAMGQNRQRPRKGRARPQQKPAAQAVPARPGSKPKLVAKGPRRPEAITGAAAPAAPAAAAAAPAAPLVYRPEAAGPSSPMSVFYPENHPLASAAVPTEQMPVGSISIGAAPVAPVVAPAVPPERVTDATVSEEALNLVREQCGAGVLNGALLDVGGRLAAQAQAALHVPVSAFSLANLMAAESLPRYDVVFCLGGEIVNAAPHTPEHVAAVLAATGSVVVVALPTGPGNIVSGPSAVATLKRWFGGAPEASTTLKAGADQVRVALWQFAEDEVEEPEAAAATQTQAETAPAGPQGGEAPADDASGQSASEDADAPKPKKKAPARKKAARRGQ